MYRDPDLTRLIALALSANHDLRIAEANLREARGLRTEVRGGLFPQVSLAGSVARDRLSLPQLPGTTIQQRTNTLVDVGFDASWEIDLFGGVRRSVEAASAQVDAVRADLEGARLSVSAETARTYFELRGLQRRIRIAQDNLKTQLDTLNVITLRANAGRGTDFDVSRAAELAETTRGAIPPLERDLARSYYALAVLTGQAPEAISKLAERRGAAIGSDNSAGDDAPVFAVKSPAELLRRRPDVLSAERKVAAASASIGVNTAELFPAVTLVGNVGLTATRGNSLSKGDALRYTVGPALSWNVLDFGRIRARIEQADARYDSALASFEKTVLQALQEAEGALVTVRSVKEQFDAVSAATTAARSAARLATLRFDAGATDLLDLLDAQRQVLSSENELSRVETARSVASVALFKAMGGGWFNEGSERDERAIGSITR